MFKFLLLQQASIYQLHNKIDAYQVQYEVFQAILQDVLIRLEASFALSKTQLVSQHCLALFRRSLCTAVKEQVIAVTKDLLYNYKRTVYMDVHLDVEVRVVLPLHRTSNTTIATG